jgi:hypothetical protein
MQTIALPKGNGRVRLVVVPTNSGEWEGYRRLLPRLQTAERRLARRWGTEQVAHGFIRDRNPVTCALAHVGPQWKATVTADLHDWFSHVTRAHVRDALIAAEEPDADELAAQVTPDGIAQQGLPTSPTAANLAAVRMDRAILDALARLDVETVYTRYADDLTVSLASDHSALLTQLIDLLRVNAAQCGWTLVPHKTHLFLAKAGRRRIVGISVGPTDLRLPRDQRRRLRAARHADPQERRPQTRGLIEWSELRLPRTLRPSRHIHHHDRRTMPPLLPTRHTPPSIPVTDPLCAGITRHIRIPTR